MEAFVMKSKLLACWILFHLPNKALTMIITLANRIAMMCTTVSFIAMGDMSIGIIARLVTDIVTFDRSVSEANRKRIFEAHTYFRERTLHLRIC